MKIQTTHKIYLAIVLTFFSCSNDYEQKANTLLKENTRLKKELAELKNDLRELKKANSTIIGNQGKQGSYPTNVDIISIKDQKHQEDTLDLEKRGDELIYEYTYKRTVEIAEVDNNNLATLLGSIREKLSAPGISVFSICDGGALPLEMCNCTDNIYVSFEPENLGEDYMLIKISSYYDVKLLDIERIKNGFKTTDYHLIFEHGKYPRKKEKISLVDLKFIKTTAK